MPGNQAERTDGTYDCPICDAFVNGRVDEGAWLYVAVYAKDLRPRRVMARVSRKQFDLDVTKEQVAEHIDNNHSDRRNYMTPTTTNQDDAEDQGCPICTAISNRGISLGVWEYTIERADDRGGAERVAKVLDRDFGVDASPEEVRAHQGEGHEERRGSN